LIVMVVEMVMLSADRPVNGMQGLLPVLIILVSK